MESLDFKALAEQAGPKIATAVEPLLTGAKEDLQNYVKAATLDLIQARASGRKDLEKRLLGQLQALAEVHRIRSENFAWALVANIFTAAIDLLFMSLKKVVL